MKNNSPIGGQQGPHLLSFINIAVWWEVPPNTECSHGYKARLLRIWLKQNTFHCVSVRRDISTFLNDFKHENNVIRADHPDHPYHLTTRTTLTSLITWTIGNTGIVWTTWTTLAIMNTLTALTT